MSERKLSLTTSFNGPSVQSLDPSTPLTYAEIKQAVPSVFAEAPHESRKEGYAFVPTSRLLASLEDLGFRPFYAAQSRVRYRTKVENPEADKAAREVTTRHLVRLRQAAPSAFPSIGVPEIILVNSHGGQTCKLQALLGWFRFACSNGLVQGTAAADIRSRHTGLTLLDDFIEGVFSVVKDTPNMEARIDNLLCRLPAQEAVLHFAERAAALRWEKDCPVTPQSLTCARRKEDLSVDSFTVMNVVEENITGGGVPLSNPTCRSKFTRPVNSIPLSLSIKEGVWRLAEEIL